jgi:hypothetical protein
VEKAEFYESLYTMDGALRHERILEMKWLSVSVEFPNKALDRSKGTQLQCI